MIESILKGFEVWTDAQGVKSKGRVNGIDNISMEGISSLRQLIMGLALGGHFSDNEAQLPDSIEKDIKDARIKYFEAINKKDKPAEYNEPLLIEFELQNTWKWKRIGELCDLQTGATPSTLNPKYYGGNIKWLVSGDINQGVIHDCEGRITEEGLKNSNCKILPANTVLIALNGQGKTRASVALLKTSAACNQSLVGMIPFSDTIIDSSFLLLALKYRYYEIRDITGQTQRRGLNMGLVSELSVPLPPLEEQKRIVAKVNELMALCDQLEEQQSANLTTHHNLVKSLLATLTHAADADELQAAWEKLSEHFDTLFCTEDSIEQLKQTILQLAIMGRLVKQDPKDEPASVLRNKIKKNFEEMAKEGKAKKLSAVTVVTNEEEPFNLPNGWSWVRLQEIIQISSGDGLTASQMNSEGNIPVYGGNGVNGYHDKANISKPTIVIGRVGFYCGSIHVTPDAAWVTDNAFITTFSEVNISLKFLYWMLKGTNLKENDNATAQPVISGRKVYPIVVGLPPLNEQVRIVSKIEELFSLCEALSFKIEKASEVKSLLSQTIIASVI